jgi:UDP-N-acetylmuramate--alanine ligase
MRVHIIGIGGIGTSSLAQYFLAQGMKVSGSDANDSEITRFLQAQGVTIFIGHEAKNVEGADEIIHTAAVKPGNVEYDEAKKQGIKTKLYAEALGEITRSYKTIAVSGSHGKSTTTAMIAKIMIDAGLDPTVIIGTKMNELGGNNFRAGKSEWFVLEADDYNRHFHQYHPYIAAITNVDREHLDIYQDLAGVTEAFRVFMTQVDPKGTLVVNGQDKILSRLTHELAEPKPKVVIYNSQDIASHELGVVGQHNQSNAEAAFRVAQTVGVAESQIRASLKEFKGTWRRLEELQEGVFTDYGHHPTEIKANLEALKEANPTKRLICVFQPHQRDRLNKLFEEFSSAFESADQTIIIPLYQVKGRDEAPGKDSKDLVAKISQGHVHFAPSFDRAFEAVSKFFNTEHIVVFMGAGDIDESLRHKLLVM